MATPKTSSLGTIAKILGIIVACGVIAAGLTSWLGTYVYATKPELSVVQTEQVKRGERDKFRDHRIQTLEVKVENTQRIVSRTDKNVELLVLQREMEPEPEPEMEPLPPMPTPPVD